MYIKGWKIIDKSYAFSFDSILECNKIGKILLNCILFLQIWFWKGQMLTEYDPFHTIIDKFYLVFEGNLLSLGLVSTNLKCVTDAFSKFKFTASIKKIERWSRDTQKAIFLFYFWVENILSPNHFKHLTLKVAVWLRGIASIPWHPLRGWFGSYTVELLLF